MSGRSRKGRSGPLSSQSLRDAASRARKTAREVAAARANEPDEYPEGAMVARRVYVAALDAKRSQLAGDVFPPLWACAAVAAEMMAAVIVTAHELPAGDAELREDIEAYLMAVFVSMGHGFDPEHFEAWRRQRQLDDQSAHDAGMEP